MIIDVHTHIPTHTNAVPADEERLNEVMRPDVSVRLNNSFGDYIRDMGPVDKAIAFGVATEAHGDDSTAGSQRHSLSLSENISR